MPDERSADGLGTCGDHLGSSAVADADRRGSGATGLASAAAHGAILAGSLEHLELAVDGTAFVEHEAERLHLADHHARRADLEALPALELAVVLAADDDLVGGDVGLDR